MKRRKSRVIRLGSLNIGGSNRIIIQSMTNTYTADVDNTIKQILELEAAGCEAVRVAIPDEKSAMAVPYIKRSINIPLIADIHFNHRFAILSIEGGADGIRINPGNIKKREYIKDIVKVALERKVAIRIGINLGSIDREKYDGIPHEAMARCAIDYKSMFEDFGFENMKFSLKASDVITTIEANRLFAGDNDYPIHLGITEAGTLLASSIKSAIGIGYLLYEGIGDTIRVSITGNPVDEIRVAKHILKALNMKGGVNIVSCPTCGRLNRNIDLEEVVSKVESAMEGVDKDITIAVMGCEVNGPGEAKEADIGIAFTRGNYAVIFKEGDIYKRVLIDRAVDEFINEIKNVAL